MPSVYIETTIPSYLAAYPSRDLVIAAHQQITHEWWRTAADRFDLYMSEAVLDEIDAGNSDAAARRRSIIEDLRILKSTNDVASLVNVYGSCLGLAGRARADLVHIAFAVAYDMDYLVTWNCRHIANGETILRLNKVSVRLGRATPVIVTPEGMLESAEERDHD